MTSRRARGTSGKETERRQTAVVLQEEAPVAATPAAAAAVTDIPLSSRAIFWRPRHTERARSLAHLPFLFWLVETLQPVRIAQIGLEDPQAYLSLCQAVDKLGLEAVAMGLEPDPGKPALPEDSLQQHAALYGDFSFVLAEDLARAARRMQGGGIDLLVIDTPLTAETVTLLQAHWMPLLSDRAVLVIHDPDSRLADREARAFLEDLQRARPGVSFAQARPGLEAVLVGHGQPERLLRLAGLDFGMPGHLSAQQVFARLGQGLVGEELARTRQRALSKATAAGKELEARIGSLQAELQRERAEKEAALAAETLQVTQMAALQAQLFDQQQLHHKVVQELDREGELEALQARLKEAEDQRDGHWRKVEALTAEKVAAAAALTEKQAGLTKLAAEHEALQLSHKEVSDKSRSHWRRVEALSADKARLESGLSALQETLAAQADRSAAAEAELARLRAGQDRQAADLASAQQARDESAARLEAQAQEIARLREQLRQSRERRLAAWEGQESLRAEHAALLARIGPQPGAREN